MDVEEALELADRWEVDERLSTVGRLVAVALAAEVRRLTAEPNLAAASTRELLEELERRGRLWEETYELWAWKLVDDAHSSLATLPAPLLDYRAVGS